MLGNGTRNDSAGLKLQADVSKFAEDAVTLDFPGEGLDSDAPACGLPWSFPCQNASTEQQNTCSAEVLQKVEPRAGAEDEIATSHPAADRGKTACNDGWSEYVDLQSGKTYYHNSTTGEVTWEVPAVLQVQPRTSQVTNPSTSIPDAASVMHQAMSLAASAARGIAAAELDCHVDNHRFLQSQLQKESETRAREDMELGDRLRTLADVVFEMSRTIQTFELQTCDSTFKKAENRPVELGKLDERLQALRAHCEPEAAHVYRATDVEAMNQTSCCSSSGQTHAPGSSKGLALHSADNSDEGFQKSRRGRHPHKNAASNDSIEDRSKSGGSLLPAERWTYERRCAELSRQEKTLSGEEKTSKLLGLAKSASESRLSTLDIGREEKVDCDLQRLDDVKSLEVDLMQHFRGFENRFSTLGNRCEGKLECDLQRLKSELVQQFRGFENRFSTLGSGCEEKLARDLQRIETELLQQFEVFKQKLQADVHAESTSLLTKSGQSSRSLEQQSHSLERRSRSLEQRAEVNLDAEAPKHDAVDLYQAELAGDLYLAKPAAMNAIGAPDAGAISYDKDFQELLRTLGPAMSLARDSKDAKQWRRKSGIHTETHGIPKRSPSSAEGCHVVFDIGGSTETVVFAFRPVGVTFSNKMPLTVQSVELGSAGYAEGVQVGWVFRTVNGTALDKLHFLDARDTIINSIAKLPSKSREEPPTIHSVAKLPSKPFEEQPREDVLPAAIPAINSVAKRPSKPLEEQPPEDVLPPAPPPPDPPPFPPLPDLP